MFADCVSDCLPEKPIPAGCAFMRVHRPASDYENIFCNFVILPAAQYFSWRDLRQRDENLRVIDGSEKFMSSTG